MNNREIIQNSIDYIEKNLKTDITPQELADTAGFSLWHYYRVFLAEVGMPVMQYVNRRRLLNAVYEISLGKKMIDAALEYGFDTHSGFFKAFKREFDCSPTAFLKKYGAKKPYRIDLSREKHIMITNKKILQTLANWDISDEKISRTKNENAFYVGDSYIIKFTKNLSALKNHIFISKELEKAGLTAATAVLTPNGPEYIKDGDLYVCLTKRIEGNPINVNAHNAESVGRSIGQLHKILQKINGFSLNDNNLLAAVKEWAMLKSKEIMKLEPSFCDSFIKNFESLYPDLPLQIIHRDPNPSNIIDNNGELGFIDFELTEKNVRIYDPCYAATAVLSEHFDDRENWFDIYNGIIRGYNKAVNLTETEKKAIPYIIIANQLICVAYFSGEEQYREILNINIHMTRWLVCNFERLHIE